MIKPSKAQTESLKKQKTLQKIEFILFMKQSLMYAKEGLLELEKEIAKTLEVNPTANVFQMKYEERQIKAHMGNLDKRIKKLESELDQQENMAIAY